ncbi:MAG: hypothetical protein Sylvanvirus4_6 [Sylvanvirus sp.]|uniref:Ankyrin repeat protein n=1 Tax=Sylvanvirus sp. TaxID=2487774 RepID=A0A3G5AHA2_9VIRU|nr:MAG: hypothetical protein Sylvanvirus4_6 [Sylvanvirus sp.]
MFFQIKFSQQTPFQLELNETITLFELKNLIRAHFSLVNCKLMGKPPFSLKLADTTPLGAIWKHKATIGSTSSVPIVLSVIGTVSKDFIKPQQETLLEENAHDTMENDMQSSFYAKWLPHVQQVLEEVAKEIDTHCAKKLSDRREFDSWRMLQLASQGCTVLDMRSAIVGAKIDFAGFKDQGVLKICAANGKLALFEYFHRTRKIDFVIENNWDRNVYQRLQSRGYHEPFKMPISGGNFYYHSVLFLATVFGQVDILKYIFETMSLDKDGTYMDLSKAAKDLLPYLMLLATRSNQRVTLNYLRSFRHRYHSPTIVMCGFIACSQGNVDMLSFITRRLLPHMIEVEQTNTVVDEKAVVVSEQIQEVKIIIPLQTRIRTRVNKYAHWLNLDAQDPVHQTSPLNPYMRWLLCCIESAQIDCALFCIAQGELSLHRDHFHLLFCIANNAKQSLTTTSYVDLYLTILKLIEPEHRTEALNAFDEDTDTSILMIENLSPVLIEYALQSLITVPYDIFQTFSERHQHHIQRVQLQLERLEETGKSWLQLLSLSGSEQLNSLYEENIYLTLPSSVSGIVAEFICGSDGHRYRISEAGKKMMGDEWRTIYEPIDNARVAEEIKREEEQVLQKYLNDLKDGKYMAMPGQLSRDVEEKEQ